VYLDRYEVNRRSIFIGNLPMNTTKAELYRLFEYYGVIKDVILHNTIPWVSRWEWPPNLYQLFLATQSSPKKYFRVSKFCFCPISPFCL